MQRPELSREQDPPDLLRRFTPTPLKAVYRIGEIRLIVETNDFALLPTLRLEAEFDEPQRVSMHWKLVRDAEVHAPLKTPVFLNTDALTVLTMGSACLLGLDHERNDLVGFIGAAVDGRTFQEFLVPQLIWMTNNAVHGEQKPRNPESSMELLDG